MVSKNTAYSAIAMISRVVADTFSRDAMLRNVEEQKAVFSGEKDISNVLSKKQEEYKEEGKPFVADFEKATHQAHHLLEWSTDTRLKGAYVLYEQGEELECIRHILLFLGTICGALGWEKASAYLNEQNTVLYNKKKLDEAQLELQDLEEQFRRFEAREGEYASTEGVVREEVYRQLSEKIEAKKKHINSLEATLRAL